MNCLRRLLRRERRFSANKIARKAWYRLVQSCACIPVKNPADPVLYRTKRTADNQQSEESCDSLVHNVWLKSLENFINFIALMDCEFDWFGKVKAEYTHN